MGLLVASSLLADCGPRLREILGASSRDVRALDDAVVTHVQQRVARMWPVQRRNFVAALQAEVAEYENGPYNPGSAGPWAPYLRMNSRVLAHPLGRLVLAHELRHLEVGASKYVPGDIHLRRFSGLWFNDTLHQEREPWGTEYDLIREVYRPEDLPRLRERYPERLSRESLDVLKSAGLIDEKGFPVEELILMNVSERSEAERRAAEEWMDATMNRLFMQKVTQAWSADRATYIGKGLDNYRDDERVANVIRAFVMVTLSGALYSLFAPSSDDDRKQRREREQEHERERPQLPR